MKQLILLMLLVLMTNSAYSGPLEQEYQKNMFDRTVKTYGEKEAIQMREILSQDREELLATDSKNPDELDKLILQFAIPKINQALKNSDLAVSSISNLVEAKAVLKAEVVDSGWKYYSGLVAEITTLWNAKKLDFYFKHPQRETICSFSVEIADKHFYRDLGLVSSFLTGQDKSVPKFNLGGKHYDEWYLEENKPFASASTIYCLDR